MAQKKAEKLRIFGDGTYPGGQYSKVKIIGQGRVNGDIESENIKILGDSIFEGKVVVDSFQLVGNGIVNSDMSGKSYWVLGNLDISTNLIGEHCRIRGWVNANGNIEMERLDVKGGLKVKGLVNAEEFKLKLHQATSQVQEIGGKNIRVKSNWLHFFGGKNRLVADIIEGDTIYLEHTTAKIVRGKDIILGPQCEIEVVEYKVSYKQDKNATVHHVNRL
ncbi:hypothetical protein [Sutcliffiella halmapala]|uniref:hypothetical protein n=1 Tax=Sutcliffiella halmapala TaxID=79882 RepID=UPI00099493EF|nr:hypothetical protein [Sutcliffiella halmapala]